MKAGNNYFLVGLDENKAKLNAKPHLIVFNQSEAAVLMRELVEEGYLSDNHPHTLVLNADQKVLYFVDPPLHIGKFILTNGDNQCTSIGGWFLPGCPGVTALDIQGLSNVTAIGGNFLGGCTGLTTFDTRGLSNVTSIGHGFLSGCTSLTTLNIQGLSNVTSIEDAFLYGDTSLTTFDTKGLSNLTSIGKSFLQRCRSLTTFDAQGLSKVISIGDEFLGDTPLAGEEMRRQILSREHLSKPGGKAQL